MIHVSTPADVALNLTSWPSEAITIAGSGNDLISHDFFITVNNSLTSSLLSRVCFVEYNSVHLSKSSYT